MVRSALMRRILKQGQWSFGKGGMHVRERERRHDDSSTAGPSQRLNSSAADGLQSGLRGRHQV